MQRFPKRSKMQNAPEARSELRYLGTAQIKEEISRLKDAVKAAGAFGDAFMTAPSPGIISTTMLNAYYDSRESYLSAMNIEIPHEYTPVSDSSRILHPARQSIHIRLP